MGEPYGIYPALDGFAPGLDSPHPSESSQTLFSTQPGLKGAKLRRHAACDECRTRKLKCTGEPTGCTRCIKNKIPCNYSQQKQMGRPRKRQKTDNEPRSPATEEVQYSYQIPLPPPQSSLLQSQPHLDAQLETPIDPSLSNVDHDLTNFQNVCTAPIAQTIRSQREAGAYQSQVTSGDANIFHQHTDADSIDSSYAQYPTDISLWPDFSAIDKLPLPLISKFDSDPLNDLALQTPSAISMSNSDFTQSYNDPDVDPSALAALPAVPACPCLPNLYLTLSTLSTLSTFPLSQHTVDTLLSAHKTAHSVIYCPVCPQQYQSGSQNLMLGCTLLNVLSDHWHRIRNTSASKLKAGFSIPSGQHNATTDSNPTFITVKEGNAWRDFTRQMIRAYVFGDATIPVPPTIPSSSSISPRPQSPANRPKVPEMYTLDFLISALLRRQRQWHRLDEPTDEFPDRLAEHDMHKHYGATPTHGRPKSIVEVAGKIHDPDELGSRDRRRDANGHVGEHGHGDGDGHDAVDQKKLESADHMVCLLLVNHSKDIVQALDQD